MENLPQLPYQGLLLLDLKLQRWVGQCFLQALGFPSENYQQFPYFRALLYPIVLYLSEALGFPSQSLRENQILVLKGQHLETQGCFQDLGFPWRCPQPSFLASLVLAVKDHSIQDHCCQTLGYPLGILHSFLLRQQHCLENSVLLDSIQTQVAEKTQGCFLSPWEVHRHWGAHSFLVSLVRCLHSCQEN